MMPVEPDEASFEVRRVVFDQVVALLRPYVKNREALATVSDGTWVLSDLRVSSARLVEVILKVQASFDIVVSDDDADRIRTVGELVTFVLRARARRLTP